MATPEAAKADLAKKRGQAATQISDPEQRKTFIAAQGEAEKPKGGASDETYQRLSKEADDTIATGGANKAVGLPSYKTGTNYVPKTGPAILHKGEAVVTKEKNMDNMKDKMMDSLGGSSKKPKKEIHKIETHKTADGKMVHIHKHHHPEHHPDEEHVSNDMAELHKHMEDHMGAQNEGEAAPADGQAPAPMTAAPSPMTPPAAGATPTAGM